MAEPEEVVLSSSAIRSVSYEFDTQTLEIVFQQRGTYTYTSVPESIFRGLVNAPSAGKYFNLFIRDGFPA